MDCGKTVSYYLESVYIIVATYNYLMKLREKLRSCHVSEFTILFVNTVPFVVSTLTGMVAMVITQFGPILD